MDPSVCCFCGEPLRVKPLTKLTSTGVEGILKVATDLGEVVHVQVGDQVHTACRKRYTNPFYVIKKIAARNEQGSAKKNNSLKRPLRTAGKSFTSQTDCIICGQEVDATQNVHRVLTENKYQDSLRKVCLERNDDLSVSVLGRLNIVVDCFAADVVYHHNCNIAFRQFKSLPKAVREPQEKVLKQGRPVNSERLLAFQKAAKLLDQNEDESYTIQNLRDKMNEILVFKNLGLVDVFLCIQTRIQRNKKRANTHKPQANPKNAETIPCFRIPKGICHGFNLNKKYFIFPFFGS